ncbi:MAG TPA: serine hydrolase [Flavobacteriaceae bacterium]|nr:serine hydrolase [Flavobacteriaceae bacterium]
MKKLKKLCLIVLTFFLFSTLNSCKVGRFVVYNFANIKDHRIFPTRQLKASTTEFEFPVAEKGRVPVSLTLHGETYSFEDYIKKNKTVAFLIIENDTIQYENYWRKYEEASVVASFSMAKSITSILVGIAIDEGYIQSVNEPITNYVPELKENGFDVVTIEHLLQMTSGIKFNESYYNPFGDAATYYYGTNLRKEITKMKLQREPGEKFRYSSGDTQLLGLVLERALKDKTLTAYLEEKLWQPLGMEFDASWSLDRKKNGLEKTFCCINATARDFAKIGRLYLNKGKWKDRQIVSETWVAQSTKIDTTNGSTAKYQYQWWLPSKESGEFMAKGILGQYIYVHPKKNLIIVRLGKNEGKANWENVLTSLGKGY